MQEGHAFRRRRVGAGIALREVARQMNIDDVTMGEYERGVRTPEDWRPFYDAVSVLEKNETYAAKQPSKRQPLKNDQMRNALVRGRT